MPVSLGEYWIWLPGTRLLPGHAHAFGPSGQHVRISCNGHPGRLQFRPVPEQQIERGRRAGHNASRRISWLATTGCISALAIRGQLDVPALARVFRPDLNEFAGPGREGASAA